MNATATAHHEERTMNKPKEYTIYAQRPDLPYILLKNFYNDSPLPRFIRVYYGGRVDGFWTGHDSKHTDAPVVRQGFDLLVDLDTPVVHCERCDRVVFSSQAVIYREHGYDATVCASCDTALFLETEEF
jgi:hypothetical protein